MSIPDKNKKKRFDDLSQLKELIKSNPGLIDGVYIFC